MSERTLVQGISIVIAFLLLVGVVLYLSINVSLPQTVREPPAITQPAPESPGVSWADSAIVGVVVGSLLSLGGNAVTHCFAMRKEKQQWLQQLEDRERERIRAEQAEYSTRLYDMYYNCTRDLALLAAIDWGQATASDSERLAIVREIHGWLTLLCLRHKDVYDDTGSAFRRALESFRRRSVGDEAAPLRDEIIALALNDEILHYYATARRKGAEGNQAGTQVGKGLSRQ